MLKKNMTDNQNKITEGGEQEEILNEDTGATGVWKVIKIIEEENLDFFLDENNVVQVLLDQSSAKIVELDSEVFRDWILFRCYEYDRKPPGSETINKAVKILSTKIQLENRSTKKLYVRVAQESPGVFWYDLGNKAVRYDKNGWEIKDAPVLFRRFNTQKPQVDPVSGKGLDDFVKLINLNSPDDKILFKTYIVSALIPEFPHPILVLHGQQGAAKSTTSRCSKDIIDPSILRTRAMANNQQDFTIAMASNWAMFYDNISKLTTEQSDQICRSSTGEGVGGRKLYTNKDEIVFNFRNILGLNGVNCVANKPDLLDRSIIIKLSRIPEHLRKTEKEVERVFEKIKPYILGECFDVVSKAIRIEPNIKLKRYPRMADFAHWGYAINEVFQKGGGDAFLEAYDNNILTQNEKAVEVNPVAVAIINLIKSDKVGEITGAPEYIYKKLISNARQYDLDYTHDKYWPKNSSWLVRKIEEIIPNLEKLGVSVSHFKQGGKRWVNIADKTRAKVDKNSFTSGALLIKDGWMDADFINDEIRNSYYEFDSEKELETGQTGTDEISVDEMQF